MSKLSGLVLFLVFTGNSLAGMDLEETTVGTENIRTVYFNGNLLDSGRINVAYHEHLKFICDVQIMDNELIKWSLPSKLLALSTNREYYFNATMEFNGQYISCQVVKNNRFLGKTIAVHIVIGNLSPPKIEGPMKVTEQVMESTSLTISCIISNGVPPPRLSWTMKGFGDGKIINLPGSSSELIIQNATFANAGEYICTATNVKNNRNDLNKAFKIIEVLVQKIPEAVIEEGAELTFPYGDSVTLSCKVEGFPLPRIVWQDSRGVKVYSKNTIVNWHQKISRVDIDHIKVANNYSCYSENGIGQVVKSVSIEVLSPFVVHEYPNATYDVHYGQPARLVCNITSSFSMRIKWFHQKTNASKMYEIGHDKAYVSSNATILQISSVDLELVGKYTCVATLVADEEESQVFSTDVRIDNLAAPIISRSTKLTVMENDWITLYCTIVAGVPPPALTWQFMPRDDTVFKDLRTASEEFDKKNLTVTDAGQYRCIAQNVMGKTKQSTDVTVRKAPVTDITEGPAVTVQFWSSNTFTCNVVAFPEPSIVWTDAAGNIVASKDATLNNHEKTSQIYVPKMTKTNAFTCTAKNVLGQSTSKVNVSVLPPFIVHKYPEDPTNVHYAASIDLICNITSLFPMRIRWFHNSSEIHASSQHTISADGTVLTIPRMDLDLIGKYKCVASLTDDEDEKKEYSADVLIDNLKAPVITNYNGNSVRVKNFDELSLFCNYQNVGDGETLCTTNIGYSQAGQYICTASNVVGEDTKQISVVVSTYCFSGTTSAMDKLFIKPYKYI